MPQIPLTRGLSAIVDDSSFPELSQHKWRAIECQPGRFYAARYETGVSHEHRRLIYMHRLIIGAPAGAHVDHENNDSLDNRVENLRLASRGQNRANSNKHRHRAGQRTSSKYKGVYWSRVQEKWVATIGRADKWQYLGRFDSEEAAARAYDEAAKERYGDFARLNDV